MASGSITFENKNNGTIKVAPIGFSWTTFFFSGFPALLRGHIVMGIVIIVLAMVTMGFSSIIFAFIYNKMYINYLIGQGAKMSSSTMSDDALKAKLSMEIPKL